MDDITLYELLGVKVKRVFSGSELIFFYELSKYCKEILNKNLILSDLYIVKDLRSSIYCQYLYHKGFDMDFGLTTDEVGDLTEISRKFFNSDLTGVVFEKKTDKEWIYSYTTDKTANLVLNKYNRSAGYVSLYAYMVVTYYKKKKKVPKLILKNGSFKQEEFEYVDILIMQNFGNKLLKDKIEIIYSTELVTQPEWEAYIIYHRQLGLMNREYSSLEKYKYISKKFEVGDIVLYYKTDKAIKSKTIRKLESCHPAVITGIEKDKIKIVYYPDVSTYLTRKRELEKAEEACNFEYKYSSEDYSKFPVCNTTLDYYNIGVDLLLFMEDEFILTPLNGVDTFEQYIEDKNGVESLYVLDTLNTIYAAFEDRGVEYNKEKFLETYFKKEKPIYDTVKGF